METETQVPNQLPVLPTGIGTAHGASNLEHDSARMNILNLPMMDSAVSKKLGKRHHGGPSGEGASGDITRRPLCQRSTNVKRKAWGSLQPKRKTDEHLLLPHPLLMLETSIGR